MRKSIDHALPWIGLSSIHGVGRVTFRKLVLHFGSPERVLSASPDELRNAGLSDAAVHEVASCTWRKYAEQELAKAEQADVTIITEDDAAYPGSLGNAPDHPLYLYVKGSLQPQDRNAVAIVGTRRPTHYGMTVVGRIAQELASAGVTIVSGMARGIDTQAHKGALAVRGRTIAVLGCGIDVAYPPENKGLMAEIGAKGAVISEYPFGTIPDAGYFPARNRIISGLSRGTIIIEAAEDSGSLITAQYALEQGRKLYAVPGNIVSRNSRGTNTLIKQGATLVESADDVLKDLGMAGKNQQDTPPTVQPPLPREEERAFRCIANEPKHIDSIMKECRASAGMLNGVLISLELKGLVKQLPGKYYVREERS
jgi:DNA processing protein